MDTQPARVGSQPRPRRAVAALAAAPVAVVLGAMLLVLALALAGLPGYAILFALLGLLVAVPVAALADYSALGRA